MITHTLIAQSLNFRQAAQQGTDPIPYSSSNVSAVITNLLVAVMSIAILAVLIYLVTAGFEWITAGGEKGKIEAARNKITGAVIGLIILAATVVILLLVEKFLGISTIKA